MNYLKTYKFLTRDQERTLIIELTKQNLKFTKENVKKVARMYKIPLNRALVYIDNLTAKEKREKDDILCLNLLFLQDIKSELNEIKKSFDNLAFAAKCKRKIQRK